MNRVPSGTEIARPFLPARDFDLSKRFYEALGFDKAVDGEVAIFNVGAGGFVLQSFGVQPPKPPAMQSWGLRVAYVLDPCGVLWHVTQRRDSSA